MARLTPEQEALYALQWNVARSDLPTAAQLEYDRLTAEAEPEAAAAPAARQVIPSGRWGLVAEAAMFLGALTGCYGAIPAAIGLFNTDNVATAVHYSDLQDLIVWTAVGVVAAGVWLMLYLANRLWKRPSVVASALGVTVFNWKTVTVPWDDVADVALTPVTRFARRGWVPGIVRKDGQVLPVAFAAFVPAGPQAHGPALDGPASGGMSEVSALIRSGLQAHHRDAGQAAGTGF